MCPLYQFQELAVKELEKLLSVLNEGDHKILSQDEKRFIHFYDSCLFVTKEANFLMSYLDFMLFIMNLDNN